MTLFLFSSIKIDSKEDPGNSINIFASDIISFGEKNSFFFQSTSRRKRTQSALIAVLGMEYRTNEKGIFYLGF